MILGLDRIFPQNTIGQLLSCSPPTPGAGVSTYPLISAKLVFGGRGPFPFLFWTPSEFPEYLVQVGFKVQLSVFVVFLFVSLGPLDPLPSGFSCLLV